MANLAKAESIVGGLRQVMENLVAPELREVRADLRALSGRMDLLNTRMDKLETTVARGFEDLHRQLDTYKDVQLLKERMARMEEDRGIPPPVQNPERTAHGPA